jgi:molybdate transport system ATP-binding protein
MSFNNAKQQSLELNLQLSRINFALQVNLTLPASGITVLFGASGSGKTTLLRCVAGLEQSQGRITLGNTLWQDSEQKHWTPPHQRDLGYVFQEASLFDHLNVKANVQYGLQRTKKPGSQAALDTALQLLGIQHLLTRTPSTLSGGERQRVAIARALATQPAILLLDEPLASLDAARRHEILPWLERLHAELHIPMLYVTHSMQELTRLADYVVLLDQGKVHMQGTVTQILSNPQFAVLAGAEAGAMVQGLLTAHDPLYHLSAVDIDGVTLWVRKLDKTIGTPVRLHILARDVSLSTNAPAGGSIQNQMHGVITGVHPDNHPATCLLTLDCQQQTILARVTHKALDTMHLRVGEGVWVQIKTAALLDD